MPRYSIQNEGPERYQILMDLEQFFQYFRFHSTEEQVKCAELKHHLPIDITKMSLTGKQTEPGIRSFFLPFERSELQSCWGEADLNHEWPEWTGTLARSYYGAEAVQYFGDVAGDFPFMGYESFVLRDLRQRGPEKLLCDVRPLEDIGWMCNNVLEPINTTLPHIGGRLIQTVPIEEDVLLRGEVLGVISLLLSRFITRKAVPHKYIPVILLSYSRMKVRFIQAYFENGRLKIQKTDAIEFGEKDQIEELQTLLCWRFCVPVGKTEWEKKIKDPFLPKSSLK